MSNDLSGGANPPTRDPVSHGRAATEGGVLTMLGVVIAWGVTLLPIEIPPAVQAAIVGLVVALGTLVFSEYRNRSYALKLLGPKSIVFAVALVLVVGCVTWDAPTYKQLATDEIVRLIATAPSKPISDESCRALNAGGAALRDEEGPSWSLNAPFLAGQKIGELASRHARLAAICFELARREAERGVEEMNRDHVRADWVSVWRNGRALQGGPDIGGN